MRGLRRDTATPTERGRVARSLGERREESMERNLDRAHGVLARENAAIGSSMKIRFSRLSFSRLREPVSRMWMATTTWTSSPPVGLLRSETSPTNTNEAACDIG